MEIMRKAHTGLRGTTVNENEWEGTIDRLNVLTNEINRALCRATQKVELRSNMMMHDPQKNLDRKKFSRGFMLIEGQASKQKCYSLNRVLQLDQGVIKK
jgi:hypothetical protein